MYADNDFMSASITLQSATLSIELKPAAKSTKEVKKRSDNELPIFEAMFQHSTRRYICWRCDMKNEGTMLEEFGPKTGNGLKHLEIRQIISYSAGGEAAISEMAYYG